MPLEINPFFRIVPLEMSLSYDPVCKTQLKTLDSQTDIQEQQC